MADRKKKVPKRIAQTVIGSLKGGVVPRIGLPYITVGRKSEICYTMLISSGRAARRFALLSADTDPARAS